MGSSWHLPHILPSNSPPFFMFRFFLIIALALGLSCRAVAQMTPAGQTFQAYCVKQSAELKQLTDAKQYPQALAKCA